MSETLDDTLTLDEETKRLLVQQMAGKRQNLAGQGSYMLPVALQAAQGLPIGALAAIAPVEGGYGIPGGGAATHAYGMLSDLTDLGARHILGMESGKLPGGDAANAAWEKNVGWATPFVDVLGPPETVGQAAARQAGADFAAMGPIGPISTGSRGATALASFLTPNIISRGAAGANAALTGAGAAVATGLVNAENGAQAAETGVAQLPPTPDALPTPPIPPQEAPIPQLSPAAEPTTAPVEAQDWKIPFTNQPVSWTAAGVAAATGLAILASRGRFSEWLAMRQGETVAQRNARLFANEPEVQAFNQRAAGTQAAGTTPPVGEAPLPGAAGSIRTEAQRQFVNENAVLNAYARETVGDTVMPSGINLADEIRARAGVNRQMIDGQIREIARTGVDPVTGYRLPSLQWDIEARIAGMQPDTRSLYNQARHYANELDNRQRLGGQVTDFPTMSTAELRQAVQNARNVPEIDNVLNASRMLHDGMVEIGVRRGYFTPKEAANLRRTHPNYLASYTEGTGLIDNPFTPRDVGVGGGLRGISADASAIDRQHFHKFFEQLERNDMQRFVINNMLDYQRTNPGTAQIVRDWRPPHTPKLGQVENWPPEVVAFRDNGVPRYVRIENTAIREALTGSLTRANVMMGAMSGLYREGTTGLLNTVATGGVFPFVSAIRAGWQVGTNTVGGAYKGVADRAVRQLTGGRIGLPADPTSMISTASHIARGVGAEGALHISEALRKGSHSAFGHTIRKMLGDTAADAISIRAQMAYNNSWRAMVRNEGLVHSAGLANQLTPELGIPGAMNRATKQALFKNWFTQVNEQYNTLNRMTPEISAAHQWGGVAPWAIRMRTLINDLYSSIAEGGHQAFYAINKHNPKFSPAQLRYETAQLTGHPGTRGRSQAVYQLDNAVPFLNITKQGMARGLRQFNENPIAAAAAHASMAGMWAAATVLTAVHAGPEAISHLVNSLTSDQAVEGPRVYMPGQPPESALVLSTEQTFRPIFAAALSMLIDALGITTLNTAQPDVSGVEMLKNLFSKNISTDGFERILAATSQTGPQLSVPLVQAIGAVAGSVPDFNLRSAYRTIEGAADQGRGADMSARQALFNPTGSSMRVPGQPMGVTSVTGDVNGDAMEALAQAVFGAAGTPLLTQYKLARGNVNAGASYKEILGAAITEMGQTAKDKAQYISGALFPDQQARLARRTPLVDRVQETLAAMKVASTVGSDTKNAGFTSGGRNALPMPIGGEGNLPQDPTMRQIYEEAGKLYGRLSRGPIAAINDITKLQQGQVVMGIPGNVRRMGHNELERTVQRIYGDIALTLQEFNQQTSQRLGGAEFDIRDVDWKKGPEQFRFPPAQ